MPETIHASECSVCRGEEVGSICEMGQRRLVAMRWHRNGRTPAPGEERRLTKENIAWARDSLCLKWWVEERAGVN